MSLLAHACLAAPGLDFKAMRTALDERIQYEIREAQRIQEQTGCSWGEALRIAAGRDITLDIPGA